MESRVGRPVGSVEGASNVQRPPHPCSNQTSQDSTADAAPEEEQHISSPESNRANGGNWYR